MTEQEYYRHVAQHCKEMAAYYKQLSKEYEGQNWNCRCHLNEQPLAMHYGNLAAGWLRRQAKFESLAATG